MRVTPKTIVSPEAMTKSDDALARPDRAWTSRKSHSMRRQEDRRAVRTSFSGNM